MNITAWLRRLLGLDPPPPPAPRPLSWTKTLADLSAENRSLTGEEIAWAREYELEQLRPWARFPRNGERFMAKADKPVTFLIHWRAPYTTSAQGVLVRGSEVLVAVHAHDAEPLGVQATPVDDKAFELRWVPEADRLASKYAGYSLSLTVAELNRDFELVAPPGGESAA